MVPFSFIKPDVATNIASEAIRVEFIPALVLKKAVGDAADEINPRSL